MGCGASTIRHDNGEDQKRILFQKGWGSSIGIPHSVAVPTEIDQRLPSYVFAETARGLRVALFEVRGSRTANVCLAIPAGVLLYSQFRKWLLTTSEGILLVDGMANKHGIKRSEVQQVIRQTKGVAHLVEHLILCESLSSTPSGHSDSLPQSETEENKSKCPVKSDIRDFLSQKAGRINASTTTTMVRVWMELPNESFLEALESMIFQITCAPFLEGFRSRDIQIRERLRDIVLREIQAVNEEFEGDSVAHEGKVVSALQCVANPEHAWANNFQCGNRLSLIGPDLNLTRNEGDDSTEIIDRLGILTDMVCLYYLVGYTEALQNSIIVCTSSFATDSLYCHICQAWSAAINESERRTETLGLSAGLFGKPFRKFRRGNNRLQPYGPEQIPRLIRLQDPSVDGRVEFRFVLPYNTIPADHAAATSFICFMIRHSSLKSKLREHKLISDLNAAIGLCGFGQCFIDVEIELLDETRKDTNDAVTVAARLARILFAYFKIIAKDGRGPWEEFHTLRRSAFNTLTWPPEGSETAFCKNLAARLYLMHNLYDNDGLHEMKGQDVIANLWGAYDPIYPEAEVKHIIKNWLTVDRCIVIIAADKIDARWLFEVNTKANYSKPLVVNAPPADLVPLTQTTAFRKFRIYSAIYYDYQMSVSELPQSLWNVLDLQVDPGARSIVDDVVTAGYLISKDGTYRPLNGESEKAGSPNNNLSSFLDIAVSESNKLSGASIFDDPDETLPPTVLMSKGSMTESIIASLTIQPVNSFLPEELKLHRLESIFLMDPTSSPSTVESQSRFGRRLSAVINEIPRNLPIRRIGEDLLPPNVSLYVHRSVEDSLPIVYATIRMSLPILSVSDEELHTMHRRGSISGIGLGTSWNDSKWTTRLVISKIIVNHFGSKMAAVYEEASMAGLIFRIGNTSPMKDGNLALDLELYGYSDKAADLFKQVFNALINIRFASVAEGEKCLREVHEALAAAAGRFQMPDNQFDAALSVSLLPVTVTSSSQLAALSTITADELYNLTAKEPMASLFKGSRITCLLGGNVPIHAALNDWVISGILTPLKEAGVFFEGGNVSQPGPQQTESRATTWKTEEETPFQVSRADLRYLHLPTIASSIVNLHTILQCGVSNGLLRLLSACLPCRLHPNREGCELNGKYTWNFTSEPTSSMYWKTGSQTTRDHTPAEYSQKPLNPLALSLLHIWNSRCQAQTSIMCRVLIQIDSQDASNVRAQAAIFPLVEILHREMFNYIRESRRLAYYVAVEIHPVAYGGLFLEFRVSSRSASAEVILEAIHQIIDVQRSNLDICNIDDNRHEGFRRANTVRTEVWDSLQRDLWTKRKAFEELRDNLAETIRTPAGNLGDNVSSRHGRFLPEICVGKLRKESEATIADTMEDLDFNEFLDFADKVLVDMPRLIQVALPSDIAAEYKVEELTYSDGTPFDVTASNDSLSPSLMNIVSSCNPRDLRTLVQIGPPRAFHIIAGLLQDYSAELYRGVA